MALIIAIILALVLFVVMTYNGMIKLRNHAKEAWSDIDVQLKRRYNLIPNIVETVKGYATHEENVLTKVTEARSNAINATNVKDQGAAENMLSGALKSLFAVAESYPELKANENFMQLQNELVDTEDKIQSARRFYNGIVRDFNTKIQQFPASIIAGIFKFTAEEFFEIENEEEKENVKVSFNEEEKPAEPETPAPAPEVPVTETAPETKEEVTTEEVTTEEVKTEEAPMPEAPVEPAIEVKPEEKPAEPEAAAPVTPEESVPTETEQPVTEEEPKTEEIPELPIEEKPAEPETPTPAPETPEEERKEEGEQPQA